MAGSEENSLATAASLDSLTPRVFVVNESGARALPLPNAAIESPVPILLGQDRWGILWATADPPAAYVGRWIEGLYTDLWWAEWSSGGWSDPVHVIRAGLGLEWDETRTVKSTADGSVYLMVSGRTDDFRRKVFFGEINTGIRPLQVGTGAPLYGSFVLTTEEKARVFLAIRNRQEMAVDITEALVDIPASTVGEANTISQIGLADFGGSLRALRDSAGHVQLLWSSQDLTTINGFTETEAGGWKRDNPGEPDELLFRWVAGVSANCGRAAIYAMVLDLDGSFRLRVSRWEDGWGDFVDEYPTQLGIYPLDGTSANGDWVVGWAGAGGDTSPNFGFWALQP